MKRLWWIVGAIVALGIVVGGVIILAPKYPFAPSIRSKVTSTVFVPTGQDVEVIRNTAKYDSSLNLLTYTVRAAGTMLVISEQPTPESFIDIPQAYDKLISSLDAYSSFTTEQGTVHLTRPKELGGKQAAVLNAKGTLVFVKPDGEMSQARWRKFFSTFVVVR